MPTAAKCQPNKDPHPFLIKARAGGPFTRIGSHDRYPRLLGQELLADTAAYRTAERVLSRRLLDWHGRG